MKATEFCFFFDFTLTKESGVAHEDFYDGHYNYRATDNQGVFHDRLVENIEDLADEFGSMEQDYLQDPLEEDGFEPSMNENYWTQAEEWVNERSDWKNTMSADVIRVFNNPELLEDDTEVIA